MSGPDEADPIVYIQGDDGEVLQGPPSKLEEAKRAGYQEIAPEAVQTIQNQEEFGTPGGMAAAAGLGALDSLTGNFGSGALGALGGEDTKRYVRGVQMANPWSNVLGSVAGAIVPALLSGGGSLAEETPLLARLGLGSEGAAGRIGRATIAGGIYGAGAQVSEDTLGDTDTTAEKLIAAIGHGALIGGAAGGAFELPGPAARGLLSSTRARAADIEAVAEKEFGHAAPGVGSAIVSALSKLSERVSGADSNVIQSLAQGAFQHGEGRELRKLLHDDGAAFQDETARAIREAGDAMLSSNKLVSAEARGDLKASYVRRAVKTGNESETRAWALKEIDGLIGGAQDTLDAGGGYTKAIEHASTAAYRAKAAIEDAESNGQMFVALDNMKRDLQKLTRNSYQTLGHMADPIDQRAARLTTDWLDKSANGFRDGLEDEQLWGKAALDQRSINGAWTKQLDAEKRFHAALTTDIGRDPTNPYLQMRGIDPGKASSYVRGIVNPDRDLTHRAVKDFIDSTKELSGAIQSSYELPAQSLAEVAKLHQAAGTFSDKIYKAEKALTFINQYKALKAHSSSGMLGTVGAVIGGPVGGAVGLAADALGNPAKQIDRLAAMERLQDRINKKMGRVGDAFESSARKLERPHALDVTPGRKSFEASAEHVRELAANPDALHGRISEALDAISTAAPKIASAIAMRNHAMVTFLASQLPQGMQHQDGTLNTKWSKPLYSDGEMRDWQHLAAALHDPVTTLEQGMKGGALTPKEVGAIKQFYPKMYGEIVADIQRRISEMKDPPSREKRLTLATLFDSPTDIDLTQGVSAALHEMYNTPEPKPGQPGQGGGNKQMSVSLAGQASTPGQEAESGEK